MDDKALRFKETTDRLDHFRSIVQRPSNTLLISGFHRVPEKWTWTSTSPAPGFRIVFCTTEKSLKEYILRLGNKQGPQDQLAFY